ncbi:MAG: trypsin-like peptidase domain-containing protein [Candidatus Bipolaricaulota bacterium]
MRTHPSRARALLSVLAITGLSLAMAAAAVEDRIIAVYERSAPSVVNITSVAYVMNWFLGTIPQEGTGSGFVYDDLGHIVTNYHVVEGADELVVTLASGEEVVARVVGSDASNDLAVLAVDTATTLPPPLGLADSGLLRIGQTVLAIGSPFGLQQTLTTGIVSALGRVIESPEANQFIGEVIQTDAAINPGNSGGPLLDLDGRVIGVNSQILSSSGSSAGIGFAISSNTIRRVVPELLAKGTYAHPWLGIETLDLNKTTIALLGSTGFLPQVSEGVLILGFAENSPAEAAGLRAGTRRVRLGAYLIPLGGDVIVGIDDVPVREMSEITVHLELRTHVGQVVRLDLVRNGQPLTVPVTLGARPGAS